MQLKDDNKPSVNEVKQIHGKDAAMLNEWEKSIYDFYLLYGNKFGVRISVVSEAPSGELDSTKSRVQFEQIISRYPSKISVKLYKPSKKKNNEIVCLKHNRVAKLALLLSIVSVITSTVSVANNSCGFTDDNNVITVERYFMGVQICKKERNPQD